MKDPELRSVSVAARGLWIDMLCLMFESDRRGYLQLKNGQPVSASQLARMTGCAEDLVESLLTELETAGVFSRTRDGMIYSRRLERDERHRQKMSENGKKGGNPALLKPGVNQGLKLGVNQDVNLNGGSSSSSSSSNLFISLTWDTTGCNDAVVEILDDEFKRVLRYDADPMRWHWLFIRRWNKLPGVVQHSKSDLSQVELRHLHERLRESDWLWKDAFMAFPINFPQLTLVRFLKSDMVQLINAGDYKIPSFARDSHVNSTGKGNRGGAPKNGPGQEYDAAIAATRGVDDF